MQQKYASVNGGGLSVIRTAQKVKRSWFETSRFPQGLPDDIPMAE